MSRTLEHARNTRARVRPHQKKALKKLLVGIMTLPHVLPATSCPQVGHTPTARLYHWAGSPHLRHELMGRSEGFSDSLKFGQNQSGAVVISPGANHVSWDPQDGTHSLPCSPLDILCVSFGYTCNPAKSQAVAALREGQKPASSPVHPANNQGSWAAIPTQHSYAWLF